MEALEPYSPLYSVSHAHSESFPPLHRGLLLPLLLQVKLATVICIDLNVTYNHHENAN